MSEQIINTRLDAIEEVLQNHNQWLADLMSGPKHCPFCQQRLQEVSDRIQRLQDQILRSKHEEANRIGTLGWNTCPSWTAEGCQLSGSASGKGHEGPR